MSWLRTHHVFMLMGVAMFAAILQWVGAFHV